MGLQFVCPSCHEPFPVEVEETGTEKACGHCGATVSLPAGLLSVGYVLEDIEICGAMGAGRNGALYQAEDRRTKQLVALRVPDDELIGGAANMDAFLAQMALLKNISHPHIARILCSGCIGDVCFYGMEYCSRGSLADRLRQGPIIEADALRLLEDLADGLGCLHQNNFIPQDLNPSKVMFDHAGKAKWCDLALARPLFGGAESFQQWTVCGTPAYISPEQARSRGAADARSNLYSLGAIAFEMLTGRLPFAKATAMDTIAAHLAEPVPDLATIAAVAPWTATLVTKLLAKDPAERFQNTDDLLATLRAPPPVALRSDDESSGVPETKTGPIYLRQLPTWRPAPPGAKPRTEVLVPAIAPARPSPVEPQTVAHVAPKRRSVLRALLEMAALLVLLAGSVGLVWWRTRAAPATSASPHSNKMTEQPGVPLVNSASPVTATAEVAPIQLAAIDAKCHGDKIKYENSLTNPGQKNRDNIGYWMNPNDWAEWPIIIRATGDYSVTAEVATEGTGSFEIIIGDARMTANAPNTGNFGDFQKVVLGTMKLSANGATNLEVRAIGAGWHPVNIKSLTLTLEK